MALAALVLLFFSAAGAPDEVTPRFPKGLARMELGTPPHRLRDGSTRRCVKCHQAEVNAWQLSGHAHARDNFIFLAALTRDDPAWCLGCHAPLAKDRNPGPVADSASDDERGITCAACHSDSANTLAGHPPEVHLGKGDSNLLCARCHEFGFPIHGPHGEITALSGEPAQQDTFVEWQRWKEASGDARGCLDCHGRGDHAFGGVERTEGLVNAVEVHVEPGALTLRLRPGWPAGQGDGGSAEFACAIPPALLSLVFATVPIIVK